MPDKYSFAKCEQYGRRLAARLCQQYFDAQPEAALDGPALLKFTPLRQVNLLVLQQLLDRWQREASQLRSPYFDFEAEAVRTALTQFMNVLSRHIRVGRAALEPLLAQAIAHTLLLATDASAAFEHLLLPPATEAPADDVTPAYLRERLRYFEASKAFFTGFADSLPTTPLSREVLRQRFEQYRASHKPELPALAPLVAELGSLLPLTEADLQDAAPARATTAGPAPARPQPGAEVPAAPPAPGPAPEPATTPPAPPATPAPPAAPIPLAPAPAATVVAPPAPAAAIAIPAEAPPAPEKATEPAGSEPAPRPVVPSFVTAPGPAAPLHEKLKAGQAGGPHLADTLRGAVGATPTLAERGASRVGSLRQAISINQRYGFINELFNGENMEYHAAIEHLDQLPTATAALAYVQQELAPRYDWGRKEEHVAKLLKLIERKFASA